jgi:hypothetical protein
MFDIRRQGAARNAVAAQTVGDQALGRVWKIRSGDPWGISTILEGTPARFISSSMPSQYE